MTALVTTWERLQRDPETGDTYWESNHIEDGWVYGFTPVGKHDHQTHDWRNGTWRKSWCYMMDPPRNVIRTRMQYCLRSLGKMY